MIRTFVTEELKRTFLPGVLAGAAAAFLSVAGKPVLVRFVGNAGMAQETLNGFIVFVLAVVVSVGGTGAFSMHFLRGPLRLMENLPISRQRIWLVRLLVSALTTVSIAGLLVVAQPSVIDQDRDTILGGLAVGLLIFAGGICWGMLVQAGSAITALLNLGMTLPVVLLLFTLGALSAEADARALDFAASAAAISTVLLCVSFFMFMRGEFDVKRRRILNGSLVAFGLLGTFAVLIASADLGVYAYADNWVERRDLRGHASRSPDGRYLSLALRKEFHHPVSKVVVIDVESGAVVKVFRQNGVWDAVWTQDGSLLAVSDGAIWERLLGTGAGVVRITRVFPSEQQIFRQRSSEAVGFQSDKQNVFVVINSVFPIQRWQGATSLIRMNAQGGATQLLTTPWDFRSYKPQFWQSGNGFRFSTFTPPGGRWIVGDAVRNVSYDWGPLSFADEASMKATQADFARAAPGNRETAGLHGVYVWSEPDLSFDDNSWLYFLETTATAQTARLLAKRKGDIEWKEVLPAFQVGGLKQTAQGRVLYSPAQSYGLWTGSKGLVARIYRSGAGMRILLKNLVTGEQFPLEDGNTWKPDDIPSLVVYMVGEDYLRITPVKLLRGVPIYGGIPFIYRPGKGPPTVLPPVPATTKQEQPPAFRSPAGFKVYEKPPGTYTAVSPDGTTHNLWPQ